MSRVAFVLAVTLAGCASQLEDGDALMGIPGAHAGAIIHGRFFTNTSCVGNDAGELRCFSSCNPVVYVMGDDLATVGRLQLETGSCHPRAIDELGNTTVIAPSELITAQADGSVVYATVAADLSNTLLAASGHGLLALGRGVSTQPIATLEARSVATGEVAWSRDVQALSAVAMLPDGGIVAVGMFAGALDLGGVSATAPHAGWVAAFDPDGTPRWLQPLTSDDATATPAFNAVAVGPGGEIALVGVVPRGTGTFGGKTVPPDGRGWIIALVEPSGAVRWTYDLPSGGPGGEFANSTVLTDGTDVFLANGTHGVANFIARFTPGGVAWRHDAVPGVALLSLAPDALFARLPYGPETGAWAYDGESLDLAAPGQVFVRLAR